MHVTFYSIAFFETNCPLLGITLWASVWFYMCEVGCYSCCLHLQRNSCHGRTLISRTCVVSQGRSREGQEATVGPSLREPRV